MAGSFLKMSGRSFHLPRIFAAVLLACVFLGGCGGGGNVSRTGKSYFVCYLNSEEDGLEKRSYEGEELPAEEMIDEFIRLMQTVPDNAEYSPLIPGNVRLLRRTLENGRLTVDFSAEYERMDNTREVLVRAGIVRTLVQIDEVSEVLFTVEGGPAHTPSGRLLGLMNADSFVEDAGKQINAIQHATINLYFANSDGTALKREARSIYYSASKPLEWAIVERIIAGPKVPDNYPTVPGNTQIISVSSSNGICYVNLTQSFITNALPIGEKLPIYSIVNSITDNSRDITAVQISVDGDSNLIFRTETDLNRQYEPDMGLVQEP